MSTTALHKTIGKLNLIQRVRLAVFGRGTEPWKP